MNDEKFNYDLMDFIAMSPTPFHAVEQMVYKLECAGYQRLYEADSWQLENKQGYYICRNDSSIIAFKLGDDFIANGINMVGAHTDSPCLKVKPEPDVLKKGYYQLGVEVYGGALLNPWFDRDLSIAGRVNYLDEDDELCSTLVNFEDPVAVIPSLAIHLDREANKNRSINAQTDIPPILLKLPASESKKKPSFKDILLQKIKDETGAIEVLDYELSFYDVQKPAYIGLHQDFIASARLDNLLSCYTALIAMTETAHPGSKLLVCTDHEEVGSASACGAHGPFLNSVLERIAGSHENTVRMVDKSMMISTDNAHAVHPNFADKHDQNHGPEINQGPVIKTNANQRYATNGDTSAIFKQLCKKADVPVQSFVVRADMACGSTIGPITASEIGVKTLDVGVPTFAMHSIRELAGRWDAWYLFRVLKEFYR
ncbi:Aspartyl aminopeptidase [hydrothermal vent metagenome]|uniref:Probable M18 family aminopeptidase 2 n=1 Tax=hydrothermal vent metagenome TaxID=652676 RepID=A0A3B0Y1S2_9ZZZZ